VLRMWVCALQDYGNAWQESGSIFLICDMHVFMYTSLNKLNFIEALSTLSSLYTWCHAYKTDANML